MERTSVYRLSRAGTLVVLLAAACAAPAFAQGPPERARGLFGGPAADPNARQTLDLTLSLAEAYDDDTLADLRGGTQPTVDQQAGYFTMLVAAAEYQRRARRVQFAGSGSSSFRYFNDLGDFRSVSHGVGLGLTAQMSRGLSAMVNQTISYSPSYLYGLFPGDPIVDAGDAVQTGPDYSVDGLKSYSYGTNGRLTHAFRRGPRLSAIGGVQYTDYAQEVAGRRDMASRTIGAQVSHNLKRNTVMNVDYSFRVGDFGYATGGTSREHRATAGFDFTPRLSATRQPSIGFDIGVSVADIPASGGTVAGRKYDLDGDVRFQYPFGRSWTAQAAYRRGLEHMPVLIEPVFVNGASASVEGLLTRRIDLRASAGYASGETALNRTGRIFDTYQGNVRVQYAMTRALAFYGEYLYYYYDFRGDMQLAPGFPSGVERNGVRAGLTLFLSPLRR